MACMGATSLGDEVIGGESYTPVGAMIDIPNTAEYLRLMAQALESAVGLCRYLNKLQLLSIDSQSLA